MNDKTNAAEFYGKHYATATDAAKLDKACSYLDMALRAEGDPNSSEKKSEMAFNAAVKAECEGFAN